MEGNLVKSGGKRICEMHVGYWQALWVTPLQSQKLERRSS